jgi:hypothetical protein
MKYKLPTLFVSLNVLNVLDKALTWVALQNPAISELNPIVRSAIGKFGLTVTMVLYAFVGFTLFYIAYRIAIMKRLSCEKNNMSPETIFLMLNVVFCLIVLNNAFWIFHKARLI